MLGAHPKPLRWVMRLVELAAVAAVIYGVADLVFSWNPLAAAPYHAHRALRVFRDVPLLWLGVIAESINGWVVTLAYLALRSAHTPGAVVATAWPLGWRLGLLAWGFWVVSVASLEGPPIPGIAQGVGQDVRLDMARPRRNVSPLGVLSDGNRDTQ